jgi:hypothetical protein
MSARMTNLATSSGPSAVYVMRPVSDPAAVIAQEEEVTGLRWVPVSEVSELPTPPELPALIRAAADSRAITASRT